ncbi:MAG: hypothetical protein KF883_00950 [Thermomicrobiales bacterium]|nr:hypothetical protein [Thermomicrobiales bacterium]
MIDPSKHRGSVAHDRRAVIKSGAGAFAALAGLGVIASANAQATPETADGGSKVGLYAVTRMYVIYDDADMDQLNSIIEDFAALIAALPGFISYDVIFDETTRGYITVGIFDNPESAEASSETARTFIPEHNLADFYVDTTPVTVQGEIVVSAGG